MKRLTAIRLINWYHFEHEILRLSGSSLLLGDNGSGKSTVLDALQLALVADLTEVRFNKAANDQGHRTLVGYVRWKLGSEDATRPGQQRYGRGASTSYVMLEFRDDRDPSADFVCGVVIEVGESDGDPSRHHFVLSRARVEDVPAITTDRLVRPSREFRAVLREQPGFKPCPDVGTYRDELRHRLGQLPQSFHRLIVKALSFKPLGQVRDFVFNYLLDPRPVDTEALQSNLEHYKRLEAEAGKAEQRIKALEEICGLGERIAAERRTAASHRYLSRRAALEEAAEKDAALQAEATDAEQRRTALAGEVRRADDRLLFLKGERDRVMGLLQGEPGFQQLQVLERDLKRTQRERKEAEDFDREARVVLGEQTSTLELLLSEPARDLRRSRPAVFGSDDLTGTIDQPTLVDRVRLALAREGDLNGRDLNGWIRRLEEAARTLWRAKDEVDRDLADCKAEGKRLEEERAELERGRQRYDDGAEALLHLLRARLKGAREPKPLCELVEVGNERWRDAVEGYLNTRRFDVLVDPQDFARALSLYEKHKRGYALPGRGEVTISGVGLVDSERILASAPRVERRSLAEQVKTSDRDARAYVDWLMGDVICCEDEQELRRHRRAITDSVMVYQNHVARQTSPHVYRRHFIGEAARLRRRDEIDKRLGELAEVFGRLAPLATWLKEASDRCGKARTSAARLTRLLEDATRLADLKGQEASLQRLLDGLDRSRIAALEKERLYLEEQLGQATRDRDRALGEHEKLAERLAHLSARRVEVAGAVASARSDLEEAAGVLEPALRESSEAHYREERGSRTAAVIREVFEKQARGFATRADNLKDSLVAKKAAYSNDYGFAGAVEGEGFADHQREREMWMESRLPEYRHKIAEAKEQAIQQLAEDVIFKLRENLLRVKGQLDTLNRALKEVPFGSERYQFHYEVDPAHRDFHDLVMEAGRYERESLFGNAALKNDGTARRTLAELFEHLVAGQAQTIKTELEAKADYREYFAYDLKIHHADGHVSLYDRVAADKSGGETQTPYYIAVLASMYRLYRETALDGKPTCGLVLLDEAFNKMDGPRIEATLKFARGLGLQLVMATPKERIDQVAPRVETSLLIHKDPLSGLPRVLDFTKEFADAGLTDAIDCSTGAADPAAGGP